MTYKEELKQQCEALSNEELLVVINNKMRYNEMIVTAAKIELRKRNVSKEERKEYAALEKKRGHLLKLRQLLYFCAAGFIGLLLGGAVHKYISSVIHPMVVWGLFLIPALLLNSYYFKPRTMRILAARSADRDGA